MSDNEDLLGEDLGDHSLADYNLGNEEEEQLLADDYEGGGSQNVPISVPGYREQPDMVPTEYRAHSVDYGVQPQTYTPVVEPECVVPNITVEVPNLPPPHSTYAPYEPRHYELEHAVPPPIPAAPIESPQIVPSEITPTIRNGDMSRSRFISERPVGAQRTPQVRDIPDTLDKVVVPGAAFPGGAGRGRTSWRAPHFQPRYSHPYRRNNVHRGNFNQRNQFPPPQITRLNMPQMRPVIRPEMPRPEIPRPEIRLEMPRQEIIRQDMRPEIPQQEIRELPRPELRPEMLQRPEIILERPEMRLERPDMRLERSEMRPERPDMRLERPDMRLERPDMRLERLDMRLERPEMRPERLDMRLERPDMRPEIPPQIIRQEIPRPEIPMNMRPEFPMGDHPPFQSFPRFRVDRPMFAPRYPFPRPFGPPRGPEMGPGGPGPSHRMEPEVRMLPVPLPPGMQARPPPPLQGKKVLINPHFKGTFQPPVEVPLYIPTRIQKSPPVSPTLENKFGPIKDIDDAAERFIAEQRTALARAATRKLQPPREPQRYIENTTIEIENELARRPQNEDDLLRRQEEFINANRAGLRRRMRSPSPERRRSLSPAARRSRSRSRSAERRRGGDGKPHRDDDVRTEESEYKRRVREQEHLREHVMRAKELRRRRAALQGQGQGRERELEKEKERKEQEKRQQVVSQPQPTIKEPVREAKPITIEQTKPDTTRDSPEKDLTPERPPEVRVEDKVKETDPVKVKDDEINSTCEELTPPRLGLSGTVSDDELELILGDIDGILSDDDDTGRFKDSNKNKSEPPKPKSTKSVPDLRAKLPPKAAERGERGERAERGERGERGERAERARHERQKIVFHERGAAGAGGARQRKRDKSPTVKRPLVTSSTKPDDNEPTDKKIKTNPKLEDKSSSSNKSRQRIIFEKKEVEKEKPQVQKPEPFTNRRVILQRPSNKQTNKSVFSRIEITNDPTKPNPGIFSRAVKTISDNKQPDRPEKRESKVEIEYSDRSSDDEEDLGLDMETGSLALVSNLPHGMTDTRLKTLAGNDVQNLIMNKEDRSAKITFKSTGAAETFKKKFNNKMVAASRLTVSLK